MNKKHNFIKMFFALLCLAAVTFFAMVESGVDMPFIRAYKNNFKKNIRNIADIAGIELSIETQLYLDDMSEPEPKPTMIPAEKQQALNEALGYSAEGDNGKNVGLTAKATETPKKNGIPIAVDSAENRRFKYTAEGIICVNETTYAAYTESGKLRWEETIQIQNPYLEVKNGYVLISSTGDKKISLYRGKKCLYTTELDGNIICAGLNRNGDAVAVTQKEYYKAQVVVLNKKGKVIFAWDSGSYDILDAAISKDRKIAMSMLNTDSGAASFITCMDVNGKTKFKTELFNDTLIFDLEYANGTLNAVADNKCMGISAGGKLLWEYGYDGKNLVRYAISENGKKAFVFSSNGSGNLISVSKNGKQKSDIALENIPDMLDIRSNYIAYNNGRDVFLTDSKNIYKTSCDADVKQVYTVSSKKVLCVYSSSIQVKKTEKQKEEKTEIYQDTEE